MSEVQVGRHVAADATKEAEKPVEEEENVEEVVVAAATGPPLAQAAVDNVLARAGGNTNWLSLIGAGLTVVPPKICSAEFPFLTQLYLGHNKLTVVPDAVYDLLSLRGLFLQNNQIARLSPKINQLQELQELFLCSNVLTCLPPLRSLVALDCLWLDDNPYLPTMITRNISRSKDSVQRLVGQISDFYGHRSENCRRSLLFFLSIAAASDSPLGTLPPEMTELIARKVWHSRYDNDWQF